jgi:hypothetical protein
MSPGKILLAVVGATVALLAAGLIVGGGGLLWGYGTQRTVDGFFTSPSAELSTDGYALTSPDVDLGSRPGDWFPSGRLATVRLDAESSGSDPVFVGIGPEADVDGYLDGVALSEVTDIPRAGDVSYRPVDGDAPSALPSEQTFWVASSEGIGLQSLTWELERGDWTVVIMNADMTPGVEVEASAGAKTELLVPIAFGLLIGGLVFAAVAAVMLVIALRQPGTATAMAGAVAAGGFGRYPVRLEGRLDPGLSRWQWLIKWFLALPHFIVLGFLWAAFAVLTLVAGVAILFTGRYPRSIFDFNVGVMRWTWRVAFYSYSALGTDQYPPFTLADTEYPAKFDVEYPERLSQGLVLVKWWLLAIPHYLIIGFFTIGLIGWITEVGGGKAALQIGGGLIGIMVLIAALALAFTGRYPQSLFGVVIGLNRWVYRVWAYAALMRDEYPPFRLDTGGLEPGGVPPLTSTGPTAGGNVPTEPDLTRV